MAKYKIIFSRSGVRDLQNYNNPLYERLKKKILSFSGNPRPRNSKKLKGASNRYRVRVGDYRILYTVDDDRESVTIHRIAHRSEAYR